MTDASDHVLDAIDNALKDAAVSADAMRWAPGGIAEAAPTKAPRRAAERRRHYPRFAEPVRWEQHKTTCTLAEIEAWLAEEYDLARHGPAWAVVDALPPTSITMHRQHPPCVGCGRPTGTPYGNALTVEGMNEPEMIAMFQPCGCRLTVSVPAILDRIPPGTRPDRYMMQVISGEYWGATARKMTRERLIHRFGERPHVILDLDEHKARSLFGPDIGCRVGVGDRVVVALNLKATLGETEHIVYRAAPDMPTSDMPTDLEGRWETRASIPSDPPLDRRFALVSMQSLSTATARPTGRVEISPEGAVAEVCEVRPDLSLH